MDFVHREKRRIRNGNNNLSQMLNRKGWAWTRAHMDRHYFRDVFSKNGLEIILKGIGSWESSKSDMQIYLTLEIRGQGIEDGQVLALEKDFTFAQGRAFFNNDTVRDNYLRNLNDLCELAHQISG